MTDVTTEATPSEAEAPVPSNPMLDATVATITPHVEAANALATKIAAQGNDNKKALIHEIVNDNPTEDEEILKYRAWRDAANTEMLTRAAAIEKHAESQLPAADDSFNEDEAKAQYKSVKDQYNAAVKFLKTMPDFDESWLTVLPVLKTLRGGNASSGGNSGGRRPRIAAVYVANADGSNKLRIHELVGEGDKQRDVSNFTLAAKFIGNKDHAACKVEPKQLHEATFAAAGTDDLNSLNGATVEFAFSPDEGKHTYQVYVVTQSTEDEAEVTSEAATSEAEVTEPDTTAEAATA